MIELLNQTLLNVAFMTRLLTALAAMGTVVTLALPLLDGDVLKRRMKSVSTERERLRQRERERLDLASGKGTLRHAPKAYMKDTVDRLKLGSWLATDTSKNRLAQAGFRGLGAETTFLFFRLVTPIGLFVFTTFYVFVVLHLDRPLIAKLGICVLALYIGVKLPEVFLKNITGKRQQSITRAFPDALDLLLICVESGMSIEASFRKVASEIGSQSVPLAEELTLATAELSYLQDRRQAYDNLSARIGLDAVKGICTALTQAERYGTPIATALRVLSQESRDQRMMNAEKKAAALPPALTVPMILFFLPVLFAVILTPALIQVFEWK